jgi:exopolysaccharide production protein ExoQ
VEESTLSNDTQPTGINQRKGSLRPGWILIVSTFIVLAISLSSLSWTSSLAAKGTEGEYVFKDNNLVQQRAGLNKYLILGYSMFLILGAIALGTGRVFSTSFARWWLVIPIMFWLWCGMSVLWSVDPSLSLRRVGHLYLAVVGGLSVAVLLKPREALWAFILSISALLLAGFMAEFSLGTFRPWRSSYRHCGLGHPNEIGLFAAVLVVAARVGMFDVNRALQCSDGSREKPLRWAWWFYILVVFLGIATILLAKSRSTLITLLVVLFLLEFFVSTWTRFSFLLSGLLILLASAGMFLSIVRSSAYDAIFGVATIGRTSHIGSLTGRVPLWQEILKDVDKRPIIGHGYGGYWTTKRVEDFAKIFFWEPPNGHSIYIDSMVEIGNIGLVLLLMFFFVMILVAAYSYSKTQEKVQLLSIGLFVMGFVHGLTESTFLKGSFGPFCLAFATFSQLALDQANNLDDVLGQT